MQNKQNMPAVAKIDEAAKECECDGGIVGRVGQWLGAFTILFIASSLVTSLPYARHVAADTKYQAELSLLASCSPAFEAIAGAGGALAAVLSRPQFTTGNSRELAE
jgi:hypothetical protein